MNNNGDQIQEAEIVTTEVEEIVREPVVMTEKDEDNEITTTEDIHQEDVAMEMMKLEDTIKRYILDIDKLQEEIKSQKEMYDDTFETDGEYAQQYELLEEAKRKTQAIKDRIMQQSNTVDLSQKIDENKDRLKDMKTALSDYLQEYQKTAETNEIEVQEGDIREIINVTRLVKKNSKYRP